MKVTVGTKFRYTYADSNPEWEVKSKRGPREWNCEVVEDEDWKGIKKVFGTEEILASIRMGQFWNKSARDSDTFYSQLIPGSIVHYNNGFKCYVRCEVTNNHELMPVTLVGNWREYDLPKRQRDGTIHYGHHVESIANKKTFKPNASNVWEFQHRDDEPNPSELLPLDLTVPPITPAETVEADKWQRLKRFRNIVNQSNATPDMIFNMAKNFLDPDAI